MRVRVHCPLVHVARLRTSLIRHRVARGTGVVAAAPIAPGCAGRLRWRDARVSSAACCVGVREDH